MLTKAALLTDPGRSFQVEQIELGRPQDGEILVRMVGVGICHTDLSIAASGFGGGHPAILGHEGSGVVESVGADVSAIEVGDHVLLTYSSCGACSSCGSGHPAYCREAGALNFSGRRVDGSTAARRGEEQVAAHFFGHSCFAQHTIARAHDAVVVAPDLPLEILGPLSCGIQTGAGTVLEALAVESGQSLAVFGAGTVGLSAVMAAHHAGADPIIVIEPDSARRELALELGASHALDSAQQVPPLAGAIAALGNGGVDFSIDTVSSPGVLKLATECLRSPGTCATLGLTTEANEVTVDQRRLLFGRTLRGVIEGDTRPAEFLPRLIDLWQAGELPFERLIQTYPFERINEACDDARSGAVIKPLLSFAPEHQR